LRITHRALLAAFVCGLFFGLCISNPAVELKLEQRLEPISTTHTAAVVWEDNFDDGNMDDWTTWAILGGTIANFTVDDGIVYCHDNQVNIARHDSTVAYGTWSFDIFIEGYQYSACNFIVDGWATGADPFTSGYELVFSTESNYGVSHSAIFLTGQGYLAHKVMDPSGWNHVDITRSTNGLLI